MASDNKSKLSSSVQATTHSAGKPVTKPLTVKDESTISLKPKTSTKVDSGNKNLMCCAETETEDENKTSYEKSNLKREYLHGIQFKSPKNRVEHHYSPRVGKQAAVKTESFFSTRTKAVNQTFEKVEHLHKLPHILRLVKLSKQHVVICCDYKSEIENLWMYLKEKGVAVTKLHGSLEWSDREKALKDYKEKKVKVLITIGKLILGIDLPFAVDFINFDLPCVFSGYKSRLMMARHTITLINEDSPRNSMLELSRDEEIEVPQFVTDINEKCRSGILWSRKPEREIWNM